VTGATGLPHDEHERLEALWALGVLDTPAEERFDRFTRLARRLFDVPIAVVSLVDEHRQWFKSRDGLDTTETPREVSFCSHTILGDTPLVVTNALDDERFAASPLVEGDPRVRFYVGCPLRAPNGQRIGALCLIDSEPRPFVDRDLEALTDLAAMVEHELAALQLAMHDPLTAVSNRRGFALLAEQSLRFCRRQRSPMALVYIDLDDFKSVNDRFGHTEGDRTLTRFAEQLRSVARDLDVVGRLGGDEFAMLLADATEAQAENVVARLRHAIDTEHREAGWGSSIAFSYGVVAFDAHEHRTIVDMLAQGDERMYAMKKDEA